MGNPTGIGGRLNIELDDTPLGFGGGTFFLYETEFVSSEDGECMGGCIELDDTSLGLGGGTFLLGDSVGTTYTFGVASSSENPSYGVPGGGGGGGVIGASSNTTLRSIFSSCDSSNENAGGRGDSGGTKSSSIFTLTKRFFFEILSLSLCHRETDFLIFRLYNAFSINQKRWRCGDFFSVHEYHKLIF
jgi:hypothetical protein